MIEPKTTSPLLFVPGNVYVEARIVTLTQEMAVQGIQDGWWSDPVLKSPLKPLPIDRHWDWNDVEIEYEGRVLAAEKAALVLGDDPAVQGAMMISAEKVPSALKPGQYALFLELLFTAPRNRPYLRADRAEFLKGVGTEMLTWAAWFSRAQGCEGRIRLDGSPDYLGWYQKRGLQVLKLNPILYEGVEYTPMELPAPAAEKLLDGW